MKLTHDHPSAGLITEQTRLSSTWAIALIVAALLVFLGLDASTGAAPVQHLYYWPIVFAGVRFGRRGGLLCAAAAIVLYHVANPHALTFRDEQPDLLQMGVFVAAGVLSARLADDARRLRKMALTDDLTGLHNLRSFEQRLSVVVRASRASGTPLSLLVLDLDRLKSLNDVYGHLAGAEAVRLVGRILADGLPPDAIACRYGGDEFVIALPESDEKRAIAIAEHLGREVHKSAPVLAGVAHARGTLSISIGVACRTFASSIASEIAEAGEALFRDADAALYAAKNGGRNRISVAQIGQRTADLNSKTRPTTVA